MPRRSVLSMLVFSLLLIALLLPFPAMAGGWAVVTLDDLPGDVIAGQATTIGFMVRQHGRTPWQSPDVSIHTRQEGSKEEVFPARQEGQPGHYVAELTFDRPGAWQWGVASGLYPEVQWMPDVNVLSSPAAAPPPAKPAPVLPLLVGAIGMLGAAGALAWLRSQRVRQQPLHWAAGLALLMLLVSGAGFASAANQAGDRQTPPAEQVSLQDPVVLGKTLFISKGCVMCHKNEIIRNQTGLFDDGSIPNLTNYSADPGFLRNWLKDPSAVRPNTFMPNLELKENEIEALIAFLNAGSGD